MFQSFVEEQKIYLLERTDKMQVIQNICMLGAFITATLIAAVQVKECFKIGLEEEKEWKKQNLQKY